MLTRLFLVLSFCMLFASYSIADDTTGDIANKLKEQWKKNYFLSVSAVNINFNWEEPNRDKNIKGTLASLSFGASFHKHNSNLEVSSKLGAGKVKTDSFNFFYVYQAGNFYPVWKHVHSEENALLINPLLLYKNYISDKFFIFSGFEFDYFKSGETNLKQLKFFPGVGIEMKNLTIIPFASLGLRHFKTISYSTVSYFYPRQEKIETSERFLGYGAEVNLRLPKLNVYEITPTLKLKAEFTNGKTVKTKNVSVDFVFNF